MPMGDRPNAAVLLYEGCTIAEVVPATTLLSHRGIDVVHVATEAKSFRDESGLLVAPDVAIDEVAVADFSTIIVPGGDPGSVIDDAEVLDLLRTSRSAGAVVAGICGGVVLLARAGVLDGCHITHNYRSPWAPLEIEEHVAELWANVEVESDIGVGVVVDGQIITALPNAGAEFAVRIGAAVGAIEASRVEPLIRHLRGELVPELFS